jgi:hypothetical protein
VNEKKEIEVEEGIEGLGDGTTKKEGEEDMMMRGIEVEEERVEGIEEREEGEGLVRVEDMKEGESMVEEENLVGEVTVEIDEVEEDLEEEGEEEIEL